MSNTVIPVTEKAIADSISLDAHVLGVQSNADGKQALYRMPVKSVGTAINEAALANKVDKVNGKGLSTNDYTDTDKSIVDNAQEALAGKLDKITQGDYQECMVYGIAAAPTIQGENSGSFTQWMFPVIMDFDPDTTADALPYYGAGGTLKVGTPTTEYDAANKSYVDTKLDKVENSVEPHIYGVDNAGGQVMYKLASYADDTTADVPRYQNGQLTVNTTPTTLNSATSKQYVDNAIASAITTTLNTEV